MPDASGDAPSSEGGGGQDSAGTTDGPIDGSGADVLLDHDAAPLGQDASDDSAESLDVAMVDAGAGACNSYANTAPIIQETCVASSAPTPQGGTPADGLYYETEFDAYTGPTGMSGACGMPHSFMAVVTGSLIDVVSFDGTTMAEDRYSASFAIQGTTMTWTFSCPTGRSQVTFGYDAAPTKLVFYGTGSSSYSFTLTRQ